MEPRYINIMDRNRRPKASKNNHLYFKVPCGNPKGCSGTKHKFLKSQHSIECTKCKQVVMIARPNDEELKAGRQIGKSKTNTLEDK